jgi:hypothetical protein
MTDKKGGIRGEGFKKESHKSGKTAFVFTDSRIIAIVPGESEDETVEIEYNEIVDYSPTSDIYYKVSDYTIGVSRATLKVKTDNNWYELRILPKYDEECEEWIESIRKRMHDEYVDILLSNGVGRIGMEILDRETGEANMENSGWNYGLGFVERHKSSSEIEKEGYETYASDFVITESGVQVTYNQFDGGSISMHRSFDEIGAVDMTNSGFILYTSSGIYKFSFKYYDKNWGKYTVDMERMQEVGEYIRSKVGEAKSEENDSSDSEDEIDKLERLADLKNEGILSEEEFKEKKQELLDEI